MAVSVDSQGDIETLIHGGGQSIVIGDRVGLVFRSIEDPTPPIAVMIHSPIGKTIVEKVLRELPTGLPQGGSPVEFIPTAKGVYRIEVKELRGKQRGTAVVTVG